MEDLARILTSENKNYGKLLINASLGALFFACKAIGSFPFLIFGGVIWMP